MLSHLLEQGAPACNCWVPAHMLGSDTLS